MNLCRCQSCNLHRKCNTGFFRWFLDFDAKLSTHIAFYCRYTDVYTGEQQCRSNFLTLIQGHMHYHPPLISFKSENFLIECCLAELYFF